MTTQYPDSYSYGQQPPPPPPQPKKQRTWLLMTVAAVAGAAVAAAVALVIIQGKSSTNTDLAAEAGQAEYSASSYADELVAANKTIGALKSSLAVPPPTVPYTPPPPPGPKTTFGDGTYLVNTDIQPGTYKSSGTGQCYWARLSSADGSLGSIIANDISNGAAVVTIAASDVAFKSNGCGTWAVAG